MCLSTVTKYTCKETIVESMGQREFRNNIIQRKSFGGREMISCCCCCCQVASVVSDSLRPHRRQPTRLRRLWDSPGKNTGVGCRFLFQCMKVISESEVAQSCLTLPNPMDCSLPGSSVHGIFQARVLEWGAIVFSPNDILRTQKPQVIISLILSLFLSDSCLRTSLVAQLVKNQPAMWETSVQSLGWEDPLPRLRRAWQPTPVIWPGEFHGLYSPWGHKELDVTEQLSLSLAYRKNVSNIQFQRIFRSCKIFQYSFSYLVI